MTSERWPAYVYGEGEDPDYRFSLANERTFLAWLRTTLALLAAGVAVDVIDLGVPSVITRGLAAMLLTLDDYVDLALRHGVEAPRGILLDHGFVAQALAPANLKAQRAN